MPCLCHFVNRRAMGAQKFSRYIFPNFAGGLVPTLGPVKKFHRDFVNAHGMGHLLVVLVTAFPLVGEIDDTSRIDDIGCRIEKIVRGRVGANLAAPQLIIGRASNHPRSELWNGPAIEFGA